MLDKREQKKQGVARLLEVAGQRTGTLILSSLLAIAGAILSLVPFIIIYLITVRLLDPSFGAQDYGYIWRLAWFVLAAVVVRFVVMYISNILSHVAAYDILYGLRRNISQHLGRLPMGYFTQRSSGELKKVIVDDVEQIESFIAHHIPDLVSGLTAALVTIIYLFTVDWRLALAALAPLPLAAVAQGVAMSGAMGAGGYLEKFNDALEQMNNVVVEYVRGMPVVKVFQQTMRSFQRFKDSVYAYRDFMLAWSKKGAAPAAVFIVLVTASLYFILPVGVWLYLRGTLALPDLLLFLILGVGYAEPLLKAMNLFAVMARSMEGIKRIDRIMSAAPIPLPSHPQTPGHYDVEFRHVSFSYGSSSPVLSLALSEAEVTVEGPVLSRVEGLTTGSEKQVLEDVNFVAREGTVTGLVGPSGAGKSTIAHLIPRFWDVGEGEILIGGVNVEDIPLDDLMDIVGFVFQDVYMYSDTVFENIRMGMEGVNQAQIIAAARAAQAHEFIEQLPQGYQTVIGEGGKFHLSGGERQRISIARVILKDAPVIILDEATVFADAENEARIQSAFSQLMQDKTVIVIAHRLSTITDADQIIVVDEGQIVGQDTHAGLLKSRGLYQKMWAAHTAARDWTFRVTKPRSGLVAGGQRA